MNSRIIKRGAARQGQRQGYSYERFSDQFGKHLLSPFRESQVVRFVDSSCLQPMEVSPGGEEVGLGYQKHACVCQASIWGADNRSRSRWSEDRKNNS